MLYTDSELLKWWCSLARAEKIKLFERAIKHSSGTFRQFIEHLQEQYDGGIRPLSPKQLQVLRKWHRG